MVVTFYAPFLETVIPTGVFPSDRKGTRSGGTCSPRKLQAPQVVYSVVEGRGPLDAQVLPQLRGRFSGAGSVLLGLRNTGCSGHATQSTGP